MTQENRELLFKDLCSRLPYGVKILYNGWDSDGGCEFTTVETLIGIDDRFIYTLWRNEKCKHSIVEPLSITDYRPFLRPMSSMTEEEHKELKEVALVDNEDVPGDIPAYIDWLNAHHFDYHNLIEKGLAIEATEDRYNKH